MSAFSAEDLRMMTKGARYERKERKKSALSTARDYFVGIINSDDFKNKVLDVADSGRDTVWIYNWNFVDNVKFGDTFLIKLLMNGLLDDLNRHINPDNSPDGIYIGFVDNRNARKPLNRDHDYTLFYSWRERNMKPLKAAKAAKPTRIAKPTVVDATDTMDVTEVVETHVPAPAPAPVPAPVPAPAPAPAPVPAPVPAPSSVEPVVLPEVSVDMPNDVKEKKEKKVKKGKNAKKTADEPTEQTTVSAPAPAPAPASIPVSSEPTTAPAPAPAPAPASAFKAAPKMDWYKSDMKSAPVRGRGRGWPVASGRGAPPAKSIPMSDAPPRRVGDN